MDGGPTFYWQSAATRRSSLPMVLFLASLLVFVAALVKLLPSRDPGAPSWPVGVKSDQVRKRGPPVKNADLMPQQVATVRGSQPTGAASGGGQLQAAARFSGARTAPEPAVVVPADPHRKPEFLAAEVRAAARAEATARAEPRRTLRDYRDLRRYWLVGNPAPDR